MSDNETIAVYDAKAQEYADLVDTGGPDPRLQDFMARLSPGDPVLDLGCGPGNAARHMAAAGLDVLAWDASLEMINLAASHDGVRAEQKQFPALADLSNGSLAGVWANFSLLHAPREDAMQYIGEIARALRPGGIFLFAVKEGTGFERDKIGRLYTYFTQDEIRTRLTELGFEVVRCDTGREPGLSGEEADWFSLTAQLNKTSK